MPTVTLDRDHLYERLGKTYSQEEFELLCFEFGVELDDVTSAYQRAKDMNKNLTAKELEKYDQSVEYAIDVPANRYDLLCMEGMARALRIFLGLEKTPSFTLVEPAKRLKMTVESDSTDAIRPFCVCAVLRGVSFEDPRVYNSFIDLQDKLHQNICRRRTLVAIGTHDLDTLAPQFTYRAEPRDSIDFVPLTETEKSWTGRALLDHYRTAPECKHLKPYTGIIYDAPNYPVIRDSKGTVLSLPPIINGRHSRIQPSTKNVFIECTATDETKANVVCSTVCAMFAEYCGFRVEPVDVEYVKNGVVTRTETTPVLAARTMTAPLRDVRGVVGLTDNELTPEAACALAEKMQLAPARYDASKDEVSVSVPVTRSDILHAVDVAEDIGIAYGYNNIPETLPRTTTTGRATRLNGFSDLLRDEVARAGYVEVLTHGLCRLDEQFDKLRHDDGKDKAVVLSNPASEEFEIVRTSLLVGALKTLECAKAHSVKEGLKLFEVNDVVHRDDNEDVGALNRRHLVATYTGMTAGFEVIHGLVDRVMTCAQIAPTQAYAGNSLKGYTGSSGTRQYSVEPIDDPTYFPGRCARVMIEESGSKKSVGIFGVVHPEVLKNFGVANPTSALELDVEALAAASSVPPCGC